jgi:hypothetical protein
MNRNEIVQNLTKVDRANIARELECSIDLVHKTLSGARNNQKVWDLAEVIATSNKKKMRSLSRAAEAIKTEE